MRYPRTMEQRIWQASYDEGVPVDINFQDTPISAFLSHSAEAYGQRPALVFMNCRMSYAELNEAVDRFATALYQMGVGKGTSVAVHLPNLPQSVISFFAIQRLGATAVMTNPLYVPREIAHQWKDAEVDVAITADFLWERHLREMREELPVREYIVASIPEYLKFPLNWLAPFQLKRQKPPAIASVASNEGVHFFRELLEATSPAPPPVKHEMGDVACIQYTGGTTGVSKGAELTQRNISYNAQQVTAWFSELVVGEEVLLACLPFFHVFGLTVCMAWPVSGGACMVLMPNPRDIQAMVKNISKERVTLFPALPALFNAINQFPGVADQDLTSLKYCFSGSAPLPEEIQRKFERLTNAIIVEGFGLTETSPVLTVNPLRGTRKIGHIGIPVPGTDIRIVDPSDGVTNLSAGEEGELGAKGPQVMKGYRNMPGETAEVLRDGWFYTGDLAVADSEGYLRIVGRKKDMIIAGGYNIFPDEIDRILVEHPAVFEACTIGVPDKKRGETVKSFVVLESGASVSKEDLASFCREHLAAYKIPRLWEFKNELPKSSMMKLLRRELREQDIAKQL